MLCRPQHLRTAYVQQQLPQALQRHYLAPCSSLSNYFASHNHYLDQLIVSDGIYLRKPEERLPHIIPINKSDSKDVVEIYPYNYRPFYHAAKCLKVEVPINYKNYLSENKLFYDVNNILLRAVGQINISQWLVSFIVLIQ